MIGDQRALVAAESREDSCSPRVTYDSSLDLSATVRTERPAAQASSQFQVLGAHRDQKRLLRSEIY